MSTFNGVVREFPHIRIDYFRRLPEEKNPPLAYLLSHVHSDHLTGLESCKAPFIYCSPATRDVLLGLEKYQHRMDFAKQILEAPTKTYRHLKKILRPIPLQTPTTLELAPGNEIRVTLFDANHCVGAVMFLIEGDGHAVLYTGDIRSEPWWVNSLTKQPLLVPYVARDGIGQAKRPLKTLDCIYADTTFASKEHPYKRFPSKSEGLIELLDKVSKYPKGTSFHLKAWTFGYEEVWEALASHLGTRVHVDAYKWKLYRALANGVEPKVHDAAKYTGFKNGNGYQEGCLTQDTGTKLHSCEKGTECAIWNKDFVQITPIITRHNGIEMAEIGAGGGQGDLGQHELDINDMQTLCMLFSLVMSKVKDGAQQKAVIEMLNDFMTKGKSSIALDDFDFEDEEEPDDVNAKNEDIERPIGAIVPILARLAAQSRTMSGSITEAHAPLPSARSALPKQITFPYSRHSSYSELCDLIGAFRPLDIYPCTVDSVNWDMKSSMSFLFGHIYAGGPAKVFSHDQYMISRMSPKKGLALPASRPSSSGSQTSRSSLGEQLRDRRRRRDSSDDSDEGTRRKRHSRGSRDDREARVSEGQRPKDDNGKRRRYDGEDRQVSTRQAQGLSRKASINPTDGGKRLHVGNLPYNTTEEELKDFFGDYLIERAHIPPKSRTNHSVAYGFVDVSTPIAALHAVHALDGATLVGRKISVSLARSASTDKWKPSDGPTTLDHYGQIDASGTGDHYSPVRTSLTARTDRLPRLRSIPMDLAARADLQDQLARAMRRRNSVNIRQERNASLERYDGDDHLPGGDRSPSGGSMMPADLDLPPVPLIDISNEELKGARDGRMRKSGYGSQKAPNDDGREFTGRLSPPPAHGASLRPSRSLGHHSSSTPLYRQQPVHYGLSPAEKSAKAVRHQEAYEAALGVGGRQWSDIGLISSGGHQVKEEEL